MLAYNLIGFQTRDDQLNFEDYAREELGVHAADGCIRSARGHCRLATVPIGIDVAEFASRAAKAFMLPDVARLHSSLHGKLIVGVLDGPSIAAQTVGEVVVVVCEPPTPMKPDAVPLAELKRLAERITTVPAGFKVHPLVEKVIADRRAMGEGKVPLDWGMGEHMAFASLVASGYPVRITGQDSGRGTFTHRHSVLHNQQRERWARLPPSVARCRICGVARPCAAADTPG